MKLNKQIMMSNCIRTERTIMGEVNIMKILNKNFLIALLFLNLGFVSTAFANIGFVANYGSDTVSVFNTNTGSKIKDIPVGTNPHGTWFSNDSSKLYVANTGSDNISIIDRVNQLKLLDVSVGDAPVELLSANGFIYTANSGSDNVTVLNETTLAFVKTIQIGTNPEGIERSADESKVYVSNSVSQTISVIDTTSNSVVDTINIGTDAHNLRLSEDGQKLYVSAPEAHKVVVVDLSDNSITNITLTNTSNPLEILAINGFIYVATTNDGTLYKIDASSNMIVDSLVLGTSLHGIASLGTDKLLVSHSSENQIAMINSSSMHLINSINVGIEPRGLAVVRTTTSGVLDATQMVIVAVDEHGNIDTDYVATVTLSKTGSGTLGGTVAKTAVSGTVTYTDIKYSATVDKETYTLTASDGTLANITTESIISDVVATTLSFTTQPNPTALQSSQVVDFTSDPIVKAVDADGVVDTDFVELVTLGENGTGTGTFTNNTATSVAGVATFTGLTLNHDTAETMQLTANDVDGTGSDLALGTSTNIVVTSNSAPVNTLPSTPTIAQNGSNVVIAGISVADVDGDNQTITLTVTNGTVTLNGTTGLTMITADGIDDASIVFTGTVANVNAALNNLTFTPTAAFAGTATFNIQTNDGQGNAAADDTLSISVTDQTAPAIPLINVTNGTTITGTGEVGATVTVVDASANTIGTAVVDASGNWTMTPIPAVANTTVLTATQADATGNVSSVSSSQTVDSTDSDATLTEGSAVSEPVKLPSTADTVAEALSLFDFTLTDGGTNDGFSTDISQVVIHTSGTADFTKVTWKLNGDDVSDETGVYDATANTLTFSGLSISIANGTNETYTVSGFYSTPTGLTENQTYILSLNGDDDLTVDQTKTKMSGSNSDVDNGTGTKIDIVATKLRFIVLPSN